MAAEDILLSIVVLAILFAIELAYFKVARRFSIIDKPNERSSHLDPVIRGGGIIFLAGVLFWFVYAEFSWPLFVLGIASAAMISFADDILHRRALQLVLVADHPGVYCFRWRIECVQFHGWDQRDHRDIFARYAVDFLVDPAEHRFVYRCHIYSHQRFVYPGIPVL
jgi:hypothetical protein